MLVENTLFGTIDKVAIAIDRLRYFESSEGYYLAFSGGKDSQVIYHLAKEAGVKFDAHYNVTGIDPPELVYFMRKNYPDVSRDMYEKSIFQLIEEKGLPSRMSRFCCEVLKEHGGEGRICVTGVRWAESNKRKKRRPFEIVTTKKEDKKLFDDNDEDRRLFENCMQKGKRVINPIIDWLDEDVWEYLKSRNIEYCKLYDQGYSRLGCIGCPMNSRKIQELEQYPKFAENYKRAIARFLPKYLERRKEKGQEPFRTTVDGWYNWWIEDEGIDYSDSFLDD
ncbi:phosphoadenosine phosphosulfate reductase family protein [Tissierella praeacuta]|uniref:phosphoadenosine phosphosulfate reductase family protein n=1 Tax=Tissierella praeacuta TaxID=43131 RepID=UPI0033414966